MCSDSQHNGKYFYFWKQGRKPSEKYFEVFSSPEDIFYLLIHMFVATSQWRSQCKIKAFDMIVNVKVVWWACYSFPYQFIRKHYPGS